MACKESVFHASCPFHCFVLVLFKIYTEKSLGPAVPALHGKHLSRGPQMRPLGSQVASTQTGMLGPFAAAPGTSGAGKTCSKPCPRDHLCPGGEVRAPGSCGVCRFLPGIRSWQVELRKTPASED